MLVTNDNFSVVELSRKEKEISYGKNPIRNKI